MLSEGEVDVDKVPGHVGDAPPSAQGGSHPIVAAEVREEVIYGLGGASEVCRVSEGHEWVLCDLAFVSAATDRAQAGTIADRHVLLVSYNTLNFLNVGVRSLAMGLRSFGIGGDHPTRFVVVMPLRCCVGRGRR